jgi:hypothetical protein
VFGEHTDSTFPGTGVLGRSNGGTGVAGDGITYDLAAIGSGRLNLKAGGLANPPAGNFAGTIASDAVGNLWFSPSNGVFQKLNAPSFHPISPVRVYDSRSALPTPGKLPSAHRVSSASRMLVIPTPERSSPSTPSRPA